MTYIDKIYLRLDVGDTILQFFYLKNQCHISQVDDTPLFFVVDTLIVFILESNLYKARKSYILDSSKIFGR